MNWASIQYAERQNLWQNWTSVPRLQVMMNKFILEEHAVLTCISANDNWSLVIFLFLQTWYGRSKRGSQVFEDCSRSIYICEGKFEGRTSKFLKTALWQMEVTRTVHAHYVIRFYCTVIDNNLFSPSTCWKLIGHIFCGIFVAQMNDVSDMIFIHALNRMIWLDDSLTIQRMQ